MSSAGRAFFQLLQTTGHLARARFAAIVLAALAPFAASHAVVMTARAVGMPERLALDLLHGVFVLSYLTALVAVAQGRAVGLARFGLAWPRAVRWPGVGALLRMAGAVVLVGLPLALLLHPLVEALEAWQAGQGLYLPVTMAPEFVMTTLVGLVIAAQTGKLEP